MFGLQRTARPFDVNYDTDAGDAVHVAPSVSHARALAFEPPQLGSGGPAVARSPSRWRPALKRFTGGTAVSSIRVLPARRCRPDPGELRRRHGRWHGALLRVLEEGSECTSFGPRSRDSAVQPQSNGHTTVAGCRLCEPGGRRAAGLPGGGGGLLAAAAKAIMFFPEPATGGWMSFECGPNNPAPLRDGAIGTQGHTATLECGPRARNDRPLVGDVRAQAAGPRSRGPSPTPPTSDSTPVPKPTTCTSRPPPVARQKCARRYSTRPASCRTLQPSGPLRLHDFEHGYGLDCYASAG